MLFMSEAIVMSNCDYKIEIHLLVQSMLNYKGNKNAVEVL